MNRDLNVYDSVLQLVGDTPLIKLHKITQGFKGNFYAKVEAFNPGHSSKDRIALHIIEEAERSGILKPGDTIIETTSGNTGFSIAMVSIQLNMDAHYLSTGPEIWRQTEGKITHLIACSGTGGTISGTSRYLKEKNNDIKVIGIDAYGSVLQKYHETREFDDSEIYPYRIEGLGKNLIPSATDFERLRLKKVYL